MQRKFILLTIVFALLASLIPVSKKAEAKSCPDLRIVFVSGQSDDGYSEPSVYDKNYFGFKTAIESKLESTNLDYEFINLDYPITSIGLENFRNEITEYITAGNANTLKESTEQGINNLSKLINNICQNTKYILGGFSQGALVISGSLGILDANKIIYAATFGDPKINFPEGAQACNGSNLSPYRAYAPDCQTTNGLLGGKNPYQEVNYDSKLGAWCNVYDVYCSAHLSAARHTTYSEDGLYENAATIIFEKIISHFDIKNIAMVNTSVPQPKLIGIENSSHIEKPTLNIDNIEQKTNTELKINFQNNYSGTIVILDDQVLGITVNKSLTVTNLIPGEEHTLALVPIKKTLLGERVEIKLQTTNSESNMIIPKTPNTGQK